VAEVRVAHDVVWHRANVLRVLDGGDVVSLIQPDGAVAQLADASAHLARVVLDALSRTPMTGAQLALHVEELAGEPLQSPQLMDELLELLRRSGCVGEGGPPPATPTPKPRAAPGNVLLCLTGAVASSHAPMLVQRLQAMGHTVTVAASREALRFVSAKALAALTHRPVVTSMWPRGDGVGVPHLELAHKADMVMCWPASASTLSRVAAGDCSHLVSAVLVATRAPTLLCPSMNGSMLFAPAVQRNLDTLRGDGFWMVPSALAHEVAHAPGARVLEPGGAPPVEEAAALLGWRLMLAGFTADTSALPVDAQGWERFHAHHPEEKHTWFTAEADPDVTALLTARGARGTLWDVGCGHGALAAWAAGQGYVVVATDVSDTALSRAAARAPQGAAITWVRDDVTRSQVRGAFDVVVDRATLHVLPPSTRGAWGQTMRARVKPGGMLLVKAAPPGTTAVAVHGVTRAQLLETLGAEFELLEELPTTLQGTVTPAPAATLFVLRRRG